MRIMLMLILLGLVGCNAPSNNEVQAQAQQAQEVEKEPPRIEGFDSDYFNREYEHQIIRDTKTEREWLLIFDYQSIVVIPLDGSTPIATERLPIIND